jgi:hypothetical protein
MCQQGNGLITPRTQACSARRWENSLRRLGESSHRWSAAGSPSERLAGTLVAEISRDTTKDEEIWIFPRCFGNWGLRSGWGC